MSTYILATPEGKVTVGGLYTTLEQAQRIAASKGWIVYCVGGAK